MSAAGDALGDSINNAIIALGTLPVPSQTIWRTIANILVSNSASSRRIGETIWTMEDITLSSATPWFDVRSVNADLSTTNFTGGFIDYLRGVYAKVVDETSTFSVTAVSGSGTVVTITLANDTYCNTILAALAEAIQYYGSARLGTFTTTAAIGFLPAGDYQITAVDTVALTITVTSTLIGSTGTGTGKFYPFRIAGSNTTARWNQLSELAFMIGGGALASGYPVRDQMQGHWHLLQNYAAGGAAYALYAPNAALASNDFIYGGAVSARTIIADNSNGAPRLGTKTRGPAMAMRAYMYTGGYTP